MFRTCGHFQTPSCIYLESARRDLSDEHKKSGFYFWAPKTWTPWLIPFPGVFLSFSNDLNRKPVRRGSISELLTNEQGVPDQPMSHNDSYRWVTMMSHTCPLLRICPTVALTDLSLVAASFPSTFTDLLPVFSELLPVSFPNSECLFLLDRFVSTYNAIHSFVSHNTVVWVIIWVIPERPASANLLEVEKRMNQFESIHESFPLFSFPDHPPRF